MVATFVEAVVELLKRSKGDRCSVGITGREGVSQPRQEGFNERHPWTRSNRFR
jgi:hypothetical protein